MLPPAFTRQMFPNLASVVQVSFDLGTHVAGAQDSGHVRVPGVSLPIPSDDAARSLQACTSSSSSSSSSSSTHDAPVLEGMTPLFSSPNRDAAAAVVAAAAAAAAAHADVAHHDDIFSSVLCEGRAVGQFVQLHHNLNPTP